MRDDGDVSRPDPCLIDPVRANHSLTRTALRATTQIDTLLGKYNHSKSSSIQGHGQIQMAQRESVDLLKSLPHASHIDVAKMVSL